MIKAKKTNEQKQRLCFVQKSVLTHGCAPVSNCPSAFPSLRTEPGAGGHLVALPGGGRRVLRRRAALVPQSGPQQGPARYGHGDLQTSVPGEGGGEE